MNFFDDIGSAASGIGDFLVDNKSAFVVGAASVAGFAVGGPIGAGLAGAAAGGAMAAVDGENVFAGAALGSLGFLGGGLGGGFIKVGSSALMRPVTPAANGTFSAAWQGVKAANSRVIDTAGSSFRYNLGGALSGLFAAGGYMAGGISGFPDGSEGGASAKPEIPTTPISGKDDPANMPSVEMPDKNDSRWPSDLTFTLQEPYKTLPDIYADTRRNFGKDPSESDYPDEDPYIVYIDGAEEAGVENYPERVKDLETQFENIKKTGTQVSEAVDRTTDLCRRGVADVDIAIGLLNTFAAIHPTDGTNIELAVGTTEGAAIPQFVFPTTYVGGGDYTENNYVVSMIEGVYDGIESIVNAYSQLFEEAGAEVESPEVPEQQQPPGMPNPSAPTAPTAPTAPDSPNLDPSAIQPPRPLDLAGTDGPSTPGGPDDPASQADQAAREQLEQIGREAAAADQLGQTGANAGMAGTPGSGLESMMLPMMMQQMMSGMMNRNQQPPGAGDLGQRQRNGGLRPGAVPAAAPAPPAAPAAATPQTSAAGAGQPPPGRVSAPPATQGPGIAGTSKSTAEGNVVYTFPDGRTQEVSAVVAQALDAAFDNPAATDAQAAYAKTPKQWTDEKDVGARVDPHDLMTGDIGYWEDRSAVLVVFGTDTSGTLEAVVDGELQPMVGPEDMRDGQGEFGTFIGFFHPPGIEKAADDSAASAAPAEAPPPDQSIAVAPA